MYWHKNTELGTIKCVSYGFSIKKYNYLIKIHKITSTPSPSLKIKIYEYANIFHFRSFWIQDVSCFTVKSIVSVCALENWNSDGRTYFWVEEEFKIKIQLIWCHNCMILTVSEIFNPRHQWVHLHIKRKYAHSLHFIHFPKFWDPH